MQSRKFLMATVILLGSLGTSLGAGAAMVTAANTLSGSPIPLGGDFNGAPTGYEGVAGIYAGTGFSAAESFAGQTVALVSGYEVVTGTPGGPLSLNTPAAANGVTLWNGEELQGLTGGGTACADPCTGEGAVSLLFAAPQAAIGLDVLKFEGGNVLLQFFTPAGVAFDDVTIAPSAVRHWTFTAESGHTIGGVTLTNSDLTAGVAFDDLRLTPAEVTSPVPIPAAAWLLISGLGGLGVVGRRKRHRTGPAT
jgi:hypothetical protein